MPESKSRCEKKCEWHWNLATNFCLGGRESSDGQWLTNTQCS